MFHRGQQNWSSQRIAITRLHVNTLGLDAARESVRDNILDLQFEPKSTDLDQPKEGQHDPDNEPHEGGNTWAGGVTHLLGGYFTSFTFVP